MCAAARPARFSPRRAPCQVARANAGASANGQAALDEAALQRLHAATREVLQEWTERLRGEVVDTLLGHSPIALAGDKKLLDASWSASLAQALDAERDNQLEVLASAAAQQQISSFGKS